MHARPWQFRVERVQSLGCRVLALLLLSACVARAAQAREAFSAMTFYPDLMAGHQRAVLFLERVEDQPAVIDGALDDACWSRAARFQGLHEMESGLPAPESMATEGWVARGKDGLYLAVRARRAPLPPAWKDGSGQADPSHPELANQGLDTFSFQFNPHLQDFTRYRFTVGRDGLRNTLRHYTIPPWRPEGWQAAYVATGEFITIEAFIPWPLLREQPIGDGDVIAFNLHRYTTSFTPVPTGPYRYQIGDHYVWQSARSHSMETVDHHPWLYLGSQASFERKPPAPVLRVYLDKSAYDAMDESGEAYVEIRGQNVKLAGLALAIDIVNAAGEAVVRRPGQALQSPDIGLGFAPATLPPGQYALRATLRRGDSLVQQSQRSFTVLDTRPKPPAKPEAIELVLTDHADLGTGLRPISTALPFPRGMLSEADLANLTVERRTLTHEKPEQPYDFRWEPVDAGFTVRNRWYRDGSIRWLGVDFQADYYRGRQRAVLDPTHSFYPTYRLNLKRATPAPARRVRVEQDDQRIVITTGPMKAIVSKADFRLLSEAWLDADGDGQFSESERIIAAGEGDGLRCAVNEGDDLVAGGAGTRVWVQEANAMRAVIVAQGDYRREGASAGQHLTRLFFVRDQPTVDIHHTYIITGDTNHERLSNAAIRLGVPGVQRYRFASAGGDRIEGDIDSSASVYLLQMDHDQFVVEQQLAGEQVGQPLHRGERTAGWFSALSQRGGVQVVGRNLWQLFPKELEVGPSFVAMHAWPRHGRDVFSDQELFDPLGVVQARFAHHGRSMTLKTPDAAYEAMGRAFTDPLRKKGHDKLVAPYSAGFIFDYAEEALTANGQGIALTSEWCVRLLTPAQSAAVEEQSAFAASFQAGAMAVADPRWTWQTRVLGELWPRDDTRFGSAELAIDQRFQQVLVDQTDRLGDYGALIWPDYHTYATSYVTGRFDPLWFHRSWVGTHYQDGRTFYLLFLRSGLDRYWRYARQSANHKMDVNTVNYASDPRVGKNQTPWGGYHVYGIFPWAGMQGISCHYQNLDYKTWDSFLTGDPRGLMQAQGWAQEMARSTWANEPTRDAMVPLEEALEVYQATHYAPLLKTIHWFKEACLSVPMDQFILPHFSQMGWWRMHEYTRDPRVAQRLLEQWGDGNTTRKNGLGGPITLGLIYRLTNDPRVASLLAFAPPQPSPLVPGFGPPHLSHTMMNLPYAMSVMSELGAGSDPLFDPTAAQTFWKPSFDQWKTQGQKRFGY
jgi:hypothetical protein